MAFETISALLAMEGHGAYVWSSIAFAAAVLSLNLLIPWFKSRRLVAQLKDFKQENEGQR